MAAKRLWYLPIIAVAACLGVAAVPIVRAACGGGGGMNAQEADLLADFLILAVKPEGDDKNYRLVEIGDTKVDVGLLGVVLNAGPVDFLSLGSREPAYDEAAEVAQCHAACKANSECRDVTYVRPNPNQPVGVCHLKRLIENASFGVMQPVAEPGERAPRDVSPPPPRLPPITAEYVPLPPRAESTAPPRDIIVPQPILAEAPPQTTIAPPAPAKRERKPLPVWLALGSVAFMFGGAGLYWHSHRRRILTRLSTRLVSNGLDRHKVSVENPSTPDIGLRFVIRQSAAVGAPNTRIDLVPAGA
jgi:hypothetical protein